MKKRGLAKKQTSNFFGTALEIVQGFSFLMVLALISLYIKSGSASSFQPPPPRAHLAAKHFRKYGRLITAAKD